MLVEFNCVCQRSRIEVSIHNWSGLRNQLLPKKWNWGQHTQLKWSTKSIIANEVKLRSAYTIKVEYRINYCLKSDICIIVQVSSHQMESSMEYGLKSRTPHEDWSSFLGRLSFDTNSSSVAAKLLLKLLRNREGLDIKLKASWHDVVQPLLSCIQLKLMQQRARNTWGHPSNWVA